jgi:transposase
MLASFFPYLEAELRRTGVIRWVPWGEYRQQHPGGYSYSQFCDHYRAWRTSRSGTFHFEQEPADKPFNDFTGKKLSIVDPKTCQLTPTEVYGAVLGYSQLTYVQATYSQKKQEFIPATKNALYFFDVVPRVLVPELVTYLKNYLLMVHRWVTNLQLATLRFTYPGVTLLSSIKMFHIPWHNF